MKEAEEAFCANCEWSGDATGLADCPVCGAVLAKLDDPYVRDDDFASGKAEDRYPREILAKVEEDDGLME